MTKIEHGGALRAAEARYPDAPKPWIDLSTGINPNPYPVGDLAPKVFTRLPEREDILALEAVAAKAYGVVDASCIVAAPGVQSLIQLLPNLLPAKRVSTLGPTYEEHAVCWQRAGAEARTVNEVEGLVGADVCVVVNPNNPDGRIVALDDLARIGAKLLIVDESFADVLPPEASFAPQAPNHRAIVLRSFGKFFGLAGLRLGFAVAPQDIATRLRDALGPWAISGPAIAIGARALADTTWQASTRAKLATDADRLDALLTTKDFAVIGGTSLFRFVRHPGASGIAHSLAQRGLLARSFADRRENLRFGLPGDESAWRRLESTTVKKRP